MQDCAGSGKSRVKPQTVTGSLLDIRNTLSINAGSNDAERKLSLKREVHMCLFSLAL